MFVCVGGGEAYPVAFVYNVIFDVLHFVALFNDVILYLYVYHSRLGDEPVISMSRSRAYNALCAVS